MRRITWLSGALLSLVLVAWNVDVADAGKGVKKKGSEHKHHGVITAVQKGKGSETIVLHTHHHGKKKKNLPAAAAKKNQNLTLTVNAQTRVEIVSRGRRTVSNIGAVHKGEHVLVMSHSGHADLIEIHRHGKKRKA